MAQPRPPDTSTSGMRPPATCPGLGLCTILPLLPRVVGPQAPGPLRHCGHGAPPAPRASGRQPRWLRHRPLRLSLGGVQHHDDHVRRASHCDHLSASAFPWSGGGRWSCSDTGRTVWRPDACPYRPAMDSAPCHPWLACVSNPVLSRSWRRAAGGNWPHHPGGTVCTPHPESRRGASPHQRPLNPPSCAAQSVWSACRT